MAPDGMQLMPSLAINEYIFNRAGAGPNKISQIRDVSSKVLMVHNFDIYAYKNHGRVNTTANPTHPLYKYEWCHNVGQNMLFGDGHTKWIGATKSASFNTDARWRPFYAAPPGR